VGISDALVDPVLELNGPSVAVTNDNWRDTQEAEIIATGIPPGNNAESAIVMTLQPGNYTAILRERNGVPGVGLVEVYDLAPSAGSQLANISTRGFVDTGDNVMIGGFIVGPNDVGPQRLIIRAIGPSLGTSGIADALQDPTLTLHDGNGTVLATNDNWRTGGQEAEIIATTIPPSNDSESAIVMTLVPGAYTGIVRGANGSTGVGLVEVYSLNPAP